MRRCTLCNKSGSDKNPVNKHHVRGKKFPDVMDVHTHTCHWFAQWVTNLYLESGLEEELSDKLIIYYYQRVIGLRHGDNYILHTVR